jgi:hypothetical protein
MAVVVALKDCGVCGVCTGRAWPARRAAPGVKVTAIAMAAAQPKQGLDML